MKILVVAATRQEIEPSLSFLEDRGIPYLITGVGMLATTYSLSRYLQLHPVDLLLHIGIGGIVDSSANVGEVYRLTTEGPFGPRAGHNNGLLPHDGLGFGERNYAAEG